MKLPRVHYTFRRDQVLSADISEFLQIYDPSRLSSFQLRCLFGQLSLEIEDAVKYGDIATIPEARKLIRHLHLAWPWAGFFLNLLRPFGSGETLGAEPILAYGLSLMDLQLVAWDCTGECTLRANARQFQLFRQQCFAAIDALGGLAEIPSDVLAGRKEAVAQQLDRILA
ncbi:MAG: hypothetical protein ACLQVW_05020 [Limisphaerales bacterium]